MKGRLTKLFKKSDALIENPAIQDNESYEGTLYKDAYLFTELKSLEDIILNQSVISVAYSAREYMHTSTIIGMYNPGTSRDKVTFALTPEEVARLANIKPEGEYVIITTLNSLYLLDKITND